MAPWGTRFTDAVRRVGPVVLGILLLGYILNALFLARSPAGEALYAGLTIVTVFLAVVFAGLLVVALYGRRAWRTWAILLAATVAVWVAGALLQRFLAGPLPPSPDVPMLVRLTVRSAGLAWAG